MSFKSGESSYKAQSPVPGTRLSDDDIDIKEIVNESLRHFVQNMGNKVFASMFRSILVALKRGSLTGPLPCAKATIVVLHGIINEGNFNSVNDMIKVVRDVLNEMQSIVPCELTIGNVAKRVLFFIRDDTQFENSNNSQTSASSNSRSASRETKPDSTDLPPLPRERRARGASIFSDEGFSIFTDAQGTYIKDAHSLNRTFMLDTPEPSPKSHSVAEVRDAVILSIGLFNDELEEIYVPIRDQALDHIHNDETILVYGHCYLVEKFLKKASTGLKRFSVIVAEGGIGPGPVVSANGPASSSAPVFSKKFDSYELSKSLYSSDKDGKGFGSGGGKIDGGRGYVMASALSKHTNIAITLIPDSNIYALMPRVNKVILSPFAVMANGGAFAPCGHEMIAVAANEYSVPIIYLASSPQITPLFPHNQTIATAMRTSPAVWSYSCNNFQGYGSSNNSNSINSKDLKEIEKEIEKRKNAIKEKQGKDTSKSSSSGGSSSGGNINVIGNNKAICGDADAGVLKSNSKVGVFPNHEDKPVDFYIPGLDYIEPDLIECYLTNTGCHLPSSTYRLLSEYYNQKDMHQ